MTRFVDRTWRPLFRVLIGLVAVLATYGGVVQQQSVRALARATERNERTIAALRAQVRALGGDPDEVNVTVTVPPPESPAPASPARREQTPAPAPSRQPTGPSSRPTASPSSRPPSRSPSPSPSPCITLLPPVLGGCR